MYILFEGVDTSGKSTQAKLLHESLKGSILTKEPGGTKLGVMIRRAILDDGIQSPLSELFLFLADRAEHFKEIIEPNLDRVIISDRGLISGIAYGSKSCKKLDLNRIIELNRVAVDNHLPNRVILLETNRELLLKRMGQKSEDMVEKRGIEYLLDIQNRMIKITKSLKLDHIIIDASKSIDEIHKIIKGYIDD